MAPALRSYRELRVWRVGVQLVALVYQITRQFPRTESFGLASQMQRAAVSIPANIAEGYGRTHRGDYLRHLSVANGSLKELETEMFVATRLGYLTPATSREFFRIAGQLGRMLRLLAKRLAHSPPHPTP